MKKNKKFYEEIKEIEAVLNGIIEQTDLLLEAIENLMLYKDEYKYMRLLIIKFNDIFYDFNSNYRQAMDRYLKLYFPDNCHNKK